MSESDSRSYRARIFERYSSGFQAFDPTFDVAGADRWGRPYQHYLRGWLPSSKDSRIVDLACGSGRLLRFLLANGYSKVTGVDVSPEQVALARQVTPNVIHGDVLEFVESQEQQFSLITGFDIIEHFSKPEVLRFLDGCRRALKPGGRIVLQTPNAESPWGSVHRYNDFTHEVGFNPNALASLLRMCSYEDIEARELGPVVHGVPSAARSAIWRAIRLGLKVWNLAETGDPGSGVFTRVFIMSARRPDSARG